MTTFLFLRITHDPLELPREAVTRGEPRIRPFVPTPVPVPPTCVSLPDRDTEPTATPRCELGLPRAHASSVPIDVHGSPDRVKDVSSFVRALIRRPHDECVRNVSPHADHVPLLILPEGTCCRRCDRLHGKSPECMRFGPTKTRVVPQTREGLRHPANRGAFRRCDRGN